MAAPSSIATRFTDLEFRVCSRLRLRAPLGLGGQADRCRNQRSGDPAEEVPPGDAGEEPEPDWEPAPEPGPETKPKSEPEPEPEPGPEPEPELEPAQIPMVEQAEQRLRRALDEICDDV